MRAVKTSIGHILPICCMALLVHAANGQSAPLNFNYIPPSPNASSLGTYGAIPVDHYAGIPQVIVPFIDIKIKNVTVPVNVQYNSGGYKNDEEASIVGLGWALNAGGVITRVKKHLDDFSTNGYFKTHPQLDWNCDESIDQEPDLFVYNFAGRAGKFILHTKDGNNNPVITFLVKTDIKIETTVTGGWLITDENGSTYQFEQKENTQEVLSGTTYNFVSSWYLTRVDNLFGESIIFNYWVNSGKVKKRYSNFYKRERIQYTAGIDAYCIDGQPIAFNNQYQNTQVTKASDVYTEEVYPYNISFPNGGIRFHTSSRVDLNMSSPFYSGRQLDRIDILKYNGVSDQIVSAFQFTYDYYLSQSQPAVNIMKRLRLTSIREKTGAEVFSITNVPPVKQPYVFEYSTNILPDKIPASTTGGFFASDPTVGLMTKMTYPTGGYTLFEYECQVNCIGARIKKITHNDGIQNTGIKRYNYIGGKVLCNEALGRKVVEQEVTFNVHVCNNPSQTLGATIKWRHTWETDQSHMGEPFGDYLVGYDQVEELSGENGEGGKTVYVYYNENAVTPNILGIPSVVPNINGTLQAEEVYANRNGNFVLVSKTNKTSQAISQSSLTIKRRVSNSCSNTYHLKSDIIQLNSVQEYTHYDANGQNPVLQTKTYSYEYANELKPSKMDETDSKNVPVTTRYKYPKQKAAEVGGVYSTMVQKNYIAPSVEVSKFKNTNTFIEQTNYLYKDWHGNGSVLALEKEQIKRGSLPIQDRVTITGYDSRGNVSELKEGQGKPTAYIWGHGKSLPIASAKNAFSADIGFTSFEDSDELHYRVNYSSNNLITNNARTGSRSFYLKPGNPFNGPTHDYTPRTQQGKFIFSCWARTDPGFGNAYLVMHAFTISPTTVSPSSAESYKSVNITNTNGEWKYFEIVLDLDRVRQLSGFTETINLRTYVYNADASHGLMVDDMRFRPALSLMTTYTYSPYEKMSSITDENNNTTYYDYDQLGRLVLTRDKNKNILKQTCYGYNTSSCTIYGNATHSGSFVGDCGQGYIGSNITYTVPANTYFASTQADANHMAHRDLWSNGQHYANLMTSCTAVTYYVKRYYENVSNYGNYAVCDVILRFFFDAACTIPASSVNLTVNYVFTEGCNGWNNYSINCNSNEVYLDVGVYRFAFEEVMPGVWQYCYYDYDLQPGSGYVLVP